MKFQKVILIFIITLILPLCIFKVLSQENKTPVEIIKESALLKEKKEMKKAEELLIKGLEKFPDNPRLYYSLGIFYKENGIPEKALENINKAISIKKDMAEGYYEAGLLYKKLGLKGEAIDAMKKAFKISHQKSNSILQIKIFYELEKLEAFPSEEHDWIEQSWSDTKGAKLNSIFFTGQDRGIAAGSIDYTNEIIMFKTNDGGKNWNFVKPDIKGNLEDIFFINTNVGWAVGYEGDNKGLPRKLIMKTSSGGKDWSPIYIDESKGYLSSIFFLDLNYGWTVGGNKVYYTFDSGINWTIIDNIDSLRLNFNDVFFINQEIGWIAGFEDTFKDKTGIIYKTVDGGKNWIKSKELPLIEIKSIYFIDSNNGWAAGWDGVSPYGMIITTDDGGKEWKVQDIFVDKNMEITGYEFPGIIMDIYFYNKECGWACGWGGNGMGLILKTSDGGKTWVREDTDYLNADAFETLFFINQDKGWLAGERIMSGPVIITNK